MSSLRQICDHQRDALGPATPRREALRVGLAGGTLLLPEDEGDAIVERAVQWNSSLKPWSVYEGWLVEQIALLSVRLEHCQHHERALRELAAARAEHAWDDDRRRDAEELAALLPRDPARIAGRLRRTAQGVALLIGRWSALGRILDAQGAWSDSQRRLALDLLGIPAELRDGPTPLDVDGPGLRARIAAEVAALEALRAGLADLDARERTAAELGLGPAIDRDLAALRRHERATALQLQWCRSQLKAGMQPYRPDGSAPSRLSEPAYLPPDAAPAPPSQTWEEIRAAVMAPAAPAPAPLVRCLSLPPDASVAPAANRHRRRAAARARRRA